MPRTVVDNIHGPIDLTDPEWAVVNTATFQRLRRIKQLGMGHLTYPNATHTRFAHSLGVFAIMSRILRRLGAAAPDITAQQQADLRLAALLHDIGHYPYSHLMEGIDKVELTEELVAPKKKVPLTNREPYPDHEQVGRVIVANQEDLLHALGGKERAERIGNLFSRTAAADPQLSKLIHSSLDMDRLDYLLRDARAAGVPYGEIDIAYLLNNTRISPKGMLGVEFKAMAAAEHFLLARQFMHRTVYYHKTTYAFEEACRQLLRRLRDENNAFIPMDGDAVLQKVASRDVLDFTDEYVNKLIRDAETTSGDQVARTLAHCITTRRPPKLLAEVGGLQEKGNHYNAGQAFWRESVHNLNALADEHKLPIGRFLLCRAKPIKIEERGALISRAEHEKLEPDEREELIMVFPPQADEPRSLIDIENTMIRQLSSHVYGICRLYLVDPDGEKSAEQLAAIKAEVHRWTLA